MVEDHTEGNPVGMGMLEIREAEWSFMHGGKRLRLLSPGFWTREIRFARYCGAIGDALHNLALFASMDYEGFDEDWFWGEIERLKQKYPDLAGGYRSLFEARLNKLNSGTTSEHEMKRAAED